MAEEKGKQKAAAEQPVAKREWKVTYTSADGQEVTLYPDLVMKYLVRGGGQATLQEIVFFLNICRARRLNPLIGDCYLIKYSNDPAAIVTSIDFFRKRARAQKDCNGWQKGVIVQKKGGGSLRDSMGLVLDDEELVGGWFEATPEGWTKPFRLEVNLKGYIKRTKTGEITKFWTPENQPTMIAKVAESQGLRTLWPDEFQKLHTAEEIEAPTTTLEDASIIDIPEIAMPAKESRFDELVSGKNLSPEDRPLFEEYLAFQANKNKVSLDKLKEMAEGDFEKFFGFFGTFKERKAKDAPANQEQANSKPASPSGDDPRVKAPGPGLFGDMAPPK